MPSEEYTVTVLSDCRSVCPGAGSDSAQFRFQRKRKEGTGVNGKKLMLAAESVLCVVLTVMLAAAVIGIYREGLALKAADPLSWIFTRAKAADVLRPVLPLLAVSLVLTCAGLFAGIRDEKRDAPVKDTRTLRDLTVACAEARSAGMEREQTLQKKLQYGGWVLFALCMVPILLYITNGNHFPDGDLEPVFYALAGHVLPWAALGIAALMISAALQEKSMQREIDFAKEQIRLEKEAGSMPEPEKADKKTRGSFRALRTALLILSVVLIAAGVSNGSAKDVYGKAIKICTECVGLG